MIAAICFAFCLFAAGSIDSEMSSTEKKATGIYKLNDQEKMALQQWINAHYQKKVSKDAGALFNPVKGVNPTLSENLMNSQYLRLSDGTLWNVRVEDVPIAQAWITPVEITVSKSENPFYPYKLTNQVSGTSILVRKADKLPPAGSPPLAPDGAGKTF